MCVSDTVSLYTTVCSKKSQEYVKNYMSTCVSEFAIVGFIKMEPKVKCYTRSKLIL